ncbi:hypothetical protein [Desulfobacula phenolica]|uniref:hypothetical protein n=1 Tax=Desulfobacula phenolica TaxID=90732 RepID=UPI000B883784|nr:hypothetical protein [Desulfobacula phenolica]
MKASETWPVPPRWICAYVFAGVYVNFITEEEDDRVVLAYGSNYARQAVTELKIFSQDCHMC